MIGLRNTPKAMSSRLAVLLLLGLTGLVACDKKGGDQAAESGQKGASAEAKDDFRAGSEADVFTFVVAADPETFDTAKMSGAPEGRIAMQLFEGLLVPGPTTENLDDPGDLMQPGVAKSFDISEDGKTYTFHLRDDAKWSNGEPVTSADFVYSWKRILTPGFPADYASMLYVIKGAEGFNTSEEEEPDWKQVGIRAPDAHTLEVELKNPTPYFPELIAFYTFFPVPKKAVEKFGDDWTRPENIVTNGAYELASYVSQKEIKLKKSSEYWDAKNVSIEDATIRIIPDRNAVTNAYRAEELHWSGTSLPVSQIASFVTHPDYRRDPLLGVYYFRVNVSDEASPLTDPNVRRALSYATDRKSLVDDVLSGLYESAHSYVPKNMAGYKSTTSVDYNPRKAKEFLKKAGFGEGGKPFPKISLLYNSDENHKLVAESIQKQWKSNLGIDIELVNKEWKIYLDDIDNLNYDVARAGWIGDYNDPMTFLGMFKSGDGNNDTGWSNAKYDGLLKAARSEADPKKREKILQEAETILVQDGPVIPIYFYTNNVLVSHNVKGLEPHNRDIHLLKYMSLSE